MKTILYISTNLLWSGSEELWSRSAKAFINDGYSVAFATSFEHPELDKIKAPHLNFTVREGIIPLLKRGIERATNFKFGTNNLLKNFIQRRNPQLVIISQGHTYQAIDLMHSCREMAIPYVTISQLVAENFIWGFQHNVLPRIQQAYTGARKNYFVSQHNLALHNTMLGLDLPNAEVVFNPCKIEDSELPDYPEPGGIYNIGLVGRIDCWHKGYDFLMQIAGREKWRQRPVRFNFYGTGPFLDYMKGVVGSRKLTNIIFNGYANNVSEVWGENQILCMPSRMEGQALALIEAAWCRRAAVVTDVGGAAELIEEGYSGFIADTPTVESVDAALERAWEQRDRWEEMGLCAAAGLKAKYPADAVAYFNDRILKLL